MTEQALGTPSQEPWDRAIGWTVSIFVHVLVIVAIIAYVHAHRPLAISRVNTLPNGPAVSVTAGEVQEARELQDLATHVDQATASKRQAYAQWRQAQTPANVAGQALPTAVGQMPAPPAALKPLPVQPASPKPALALPAKASAKSASGKADGAKPGVPAVRSASAQIEHAGQHNGKAAAASSAVSDMLRRLNERIQAKAIAGQSREKQATVPGISGTDLDRWADSAALHIARDERQVRMIDLMMAANLSLADAEYATPLIAPSASPAAAPGKAAGAAVPSHIAAAPDHMAALVSYARAMAAQVDKSGEPVGGVAVSMYRPLNNVPAAVTGAGPAPNIRDGTAQPRSVAAITPFPIMPTTDIKPIPAREIRAGGDAADWIYLDSWYEMGPFANPGRANLKTPFPPQARVDLDDSYQGKDGRDLKWRFVQSDQPEVVPENAEEYGVWYFATEFKCDTARDLWVATGSDDNGQLWVNGNRVWLSSDELKSWQINEALTRVHFNSGVNTVLFRLENGWRGTGFSVVIKVRDARPDQNQFKPVN